MQANTSLPVTKKKKVAEIKVMWAVQNLSSSSFYCWNSAVWVAVTDTVTKNMKKTLAPPNFHSDECSLLALLGSL